MQIVVVVEGESLGSEPSGVEPFSFRFEFFIGLQIPQLHRSQEHLNEQLKRQMVENAFHRSPFVYL